MMTYRRADGQAATGAQTSLACAMALWNLFHLMTGRYRA
jgi:hypothetical protein